MNDIQKAIHELHLEWGKHVDLLSKAMTSHDYVTAKKEETYIDAMEKAIDILHNYK